MKGGRDREKRVESEVTRTQATQPVRERSAECGSYPLWGSSSATVLFRSKGGGPFHEHIFFSPSTLISVAFLSSTEETLRVSFSSLVVKLYSGERSPIFCLLGRPHPQTTPSLHSRLWVLPITLIMTVPAYPPRLQKKNSSKANGKSRVYCPNPPHQENKKI